MNNLNRDRMNLRVEKAAEYDGKFLQYNLPLEIGCFSFDSDSKYCNDNHQMKYLSMPDRMTGLNMDLNEGYDDYIDVYEDTENTFSAILRWILSHEEKVEKHFLDHVSSRPKIDFICFRGLLTKISSTIYEKNEDWLIYATKFRSVIYLSEVKTERKTEEEENLTEIRTRMVTWGFKFEQYMVSDAMHSKPDTSVPVNENEKYFSVMKGKLGQHRILFSAEVDGVDPKHFEIPGHDPTSVLRYTELKTSRIITSEKQGWNFRRYKLIKWYLQSFFSGTPEVICGFRDDDGIVRDLGVFKVRDIPKLAHNLWSPAACLNFCSDFLDHLKQCVVKDDPNVVYKIYWKPGSDIVCEELDAECRFLPDWYTEEINVL